MLVKSSFYFVVACAVITCVNADSVSTKIEECPQICPALYSPLCAFNGKIFKEFVNTCMLKTSNCRLKHNNLQKYVATAMDFCSTELVNDLNQLLVKMGNLDITQPDCLKPCAMIYTPICISNGKYRAVVSNKCVMEILNCVAAKKGLENFRVLQQGAECAVVNNIAHQ